MKSAQLILGAILLGVVASISFGQVVGPGGVTGTSVQVQTLSTGTVLSVTGAASADRRYVGMSVDVQGSSLDGLDTFVLSNPSAAAGGIAGNGRPQAVGLMRAPFRPAQVGKVVIVDNDKPLLAHAVKAADLKEMSLKDVMRRLSDASKENIVLGIRGLEQAKVDVNAKHDFSLPEGTMKDALLAVLKTAVPEQNMVIDATDKVITVSTQAQADQVLVTKTYYLDDLLARIPRIVAGGTDLNKVGAPDTAPQAPIGIEAAAKDTHHALDLGKRVADVPAPVAKPKAGAHATSTNMLEILTDTVRPEVWANHGGNSEVYQVGDKVTVKAPASVHALLEGPSVHNPNKVDSYIQYGQ